MTTPASSGNSWFIFGSMTVLAVSVGGGVLGSTIVASKTYSQSLQTKADLSTKSERSLSVTGSARKRIVSDLAVWKFSLKIEAPDLKSGYKTIQEGTQKALAFLTAKGFTEAEITQDAVNTEEQFKEVLLSGSKEHTIKESKGFTFSRLITVTTNKIEPVSKTCGQVTELIQDGYQVLSSPPSYHYTKLADLKVEMTGLAAKNARERADQIALHTKSVVSDVRSARLGVFQITRPESEDVSDSGISDTSSIEKDVSAVVSLSLGLEPAK